MGWLKSFRRDRGAPAWSTLSQSDWRDFTKQVISTLNTAGITYEAEFDEGFIRLSNGDRMGLENVARRFGHADPIHRSEVINDHFETILQKATIAAPRPDELEALLRVRIYPEGHMASDGIRDASVVRAFEVGLIEVLCVDMPRAIRNCKREEIERAGLPESEAWKVALANTFSQEQFTVERANVPGPDLTLTLVSGSLYASSGLLALDRFIFPATEHPVLAAIPTRDQLLWLEAPTERRAAHFQFLAQLARKMYDDLDGALTPVVFEWRDGKLGGIVEA